MKYTLLSLLALVVFALHIQSCNEKVELSGDFEETAIVYGLLDQSDSVHLIKITRAYIVPGSATIADSNYFPSVKATVTEKIGGSTGRIWTLFDTIITNKDQGGLFYAPEQKLYAFYTQGQDNSNSPTGEALLDDATYELHILINEGMSSEFEVTAQTGIVTGITGGSTDSPIYQFKFAKGAVTTGEYNDFSFAGNPGNAAIINATLNVQYIEFFGSDSIVRSFNWKLGEAPFDVNSTQYSFGVNGITFYNLMASSCATGDASVFKRQFYGLNVKVVGGAEEFYNYMLVNQPSSSLAQTKPTYTNLSATNEHPVVGIFSSRYTHEVWHPFVNPNSQNLRAIDKNSTYELCVGPITGQYLFCSQHPYDIALGQSWACQ